MNDDDMTDTQHTQPAPPRRTLRRSQQDNILAGVAAGLGEHFAINAWWFRWAFVILAFVGGIGVLLYALAWILIPNEGEEITPAVRWLESVDLTDAGTILGVVLIGAAAIVVATWVIDIPSSLVFAAVLFAVGLLLYRGDLLGQNRGTATGPTDSPDGPDTGASSDGAHTSRHPKDPDNRTPETDVVGEVPTASALVGAQTSTSGAATGGVDGRASSAKKQREPKPERESSMLGRLTIATVLIVLSAMALFESSGISIAGRDGGELFDPVHYAATGMAIIGLGLIVGAFVGRARWLIVVGVVVLPVVFLSSVWPRTFDWTADDRYIFPETAQQVQSEYSLGAGQLELDFRGLDSGEFAELGPVSITVGAGEIVLWIPSDAGFRFTGDVGLGQIEVVEDSREVGPDDIGHQTVLLDSTGGVNTQLEFRSGPDPHNLAFDVELGVGRIQVIVAERTES